MLAENEELKFDQRETGPNEERESKRTESTATGEEEGVEGATTTYTESSWREEERAGGIKKWSTCKAAYSGRSN